MTTEISRQPSPQAGRGTDTRRDAAARLDSVRLDSVRLDIDPQTGDYLIGDKSETGYHTLRLLAIGSLYAVNNCRDRLHTLGYAEPREWSQPLPLSNTGGILRGLTPTDVMRILTKRISIPQRSH